MSGSRVGAANEIPVFIPAGDETLFGILTRPDVSATDAAVVLAHGGSPSMTSFQRNRIAVRLARRLAARGCHVLRFDYHGVGESTGWIERFRLDDPCSPDLQAAARWLRDQGFARLVVVGSCFGGRTALAAARGIEGLEAIALIAITVCDDLDAQRADRHSIWAYVRRGLRPTTLRDLLDRQRRRIYMRAARHKVRALLGRFYRAARYRQPVDTLMVSPAVIQQLTGAVDRGLALLFIYGEDDTFYRDFQSAQRGRLGRILARAGPRVEIRADLPGMLHGYRTLAVQDAFLDAMESWVVRQVGESSAEPAGSVGSVRSLA